MTTADHYGEPIPQNWTAIPAMMLSAKDCFGEAEMVVYGFLLLSFTQFVDWIRCAAGSCVLSGIDKVIS
ncbi:hypothetical protein A8144_03205 [Mycobacterium leprae 3125609]|nr:hypothetical protein A8144_03205 [Mycobacterium leprae 3125609]OAX70942.1 hypothetical protein A3216_08915 [Mycobacterium leprae 7935681]